MLKKILIVLYLLNLAACSWSSKSVPLENKVSKHSHKEHQHHVDSEQKTIETKKPENKNSAFTSPSWLKITYSKAFKPEGSFYYFEDLVVIDKATNKIIDSFPLRTWGSVALQNQKNKVFWGIQGDAYEFGIHYSYDSKSKKVIRKGSCYMGHSNVPKMEYESVIPKSDGNKIDWEQKVKELEELALYGNLYAYNFFMNPSKKQKIFHKYNDGAASFTPTQERLKFYKSVGCKWKGE